MCFFLSAGFFSESARHKSQVRVAALIIASPSTRQARMARSRGDSGDSVPRFRGWAPSSFCRSGSVFVLQLRLGPRFTTVAQFSYFASTSLAMTPSLWLRLTEAGVVLRPFEPPGRSSSKVSGLEHRLRPSDSKPRAESEHTGAETESGLETPELCSQVWPAPR